MSTVFPLVNTLRASEAVESVKYSGKLYQGHGPLEAEQTEVRILASDWSILIT